MQKLFGICILILVYLEGNCQNIPTIIGKEITESKGAFTYSVEFTMTPESVPQTDSLRFQWIRFHTGNIQHQYTGQIRKTPNSDEYRFGTYLLGPYGVDIYKNSAFYQTETFDNLNCYVKLTAYFKNGTEKTGTYFFNNVNAIIQNVEKSYSDMEILKIVDYNGRSNYENYFNNITGLYLLTYANGSIRKIYIK